MALAGAVSPLVVGVLLDMSHGRWAVAFVVSIAMLLLGPIFTLRIRLDEPASLANPASGGAAVTPAVAHAHSHSR